MYCAISNSFVWVLIWCVLAKYSKSSQRSREGSEDGILWGVTLIMWMYLFSIENKNTSGSMVYWSKAYKAYSAIYQVDADKSSTQNKHQIKLRNLWVS